MTCLKYLSHVVHRRERFCVSLWGLIDEVSEDGKIKLSMVDSSLHGGPETRLKKENETIEAKSRRDGW